MAQYMNNRQKTRHAGLSYAKRAARCAGHTYIKGKYICILLLSGCICAALSGCGEKAPETDAGWEVIQPDADSAASADAGNSAGDADTEGAGADVGTGTDVKPAAENANTEITIPAGLAGDEVSDEHITYVDEDSANITYSLSEDEQGDIVRQLSEEITDSIATILADKEYYPDIVSISPSGDYTEYTIALDGGNMNVYESMLVMSFFIVGDKYQIYNGVPAEDAVTVVRYVDSATGAVISEADSTSMEN